MTTRTSRLARFLHVRGLCADYDVRMALFKSRIRAGERDVSRCMVRLAAGYGNQSRSFNFVQVHYQRSRFHVVQVQVPARSIMSKYTASEFLDRCPGTSPASSRFMIYQVLVPGVVHKLSRIQLPASRSHVVSTGFNSSPADRFMPSDANNTPMSQVPPSASLAQTRYRVVEVQTRFNKLARPILELVPKLGAYPSPCLHSVSKTLASRIKCATVPTFTPHHPSITHRHHTLQPSSPPSTPPSRSKVLRYHKPSSIHLHNTIPDRYHHLTDLRSSAASTSSSPRRSSHKCRSQTVSPRVDSKKILRHLVTPPVGHRASSFDEYLHLRTQTPKCSVWIFGPVSSLLISCPLFSRLRSFLNDPRPRVEFRPSPRPMVSEEYTRLQSVDSRSCSPVLVVSTADALPISSSYAKIMHSKVLFTVAFLEANEPSLPTSYFSQLIVGLSRDLVISKRVPTSRLPSYTCLNQIFGKLWMPNAQLKESERRCLQAPPTVSRPPFRGSSGAFKVEGEWGGRARHKQQAQCTYVCLTQERTRSTDIATELRRSDDVSVEGTSVEGLMRETSLTSLAPSPSRQDKKVTFAKLLEKMSKEMSSSSSDVSCAEDKSPSRIFNFGSVRRSPRRSPRIRHTQRYSGSGSEDVIETPDISSSEMTPDPPKRLLTVKSSSSPCSKTSSPQSRNKLHKISSADSLLAMFRNFGGSCFKEKGDLSNHPTRRHFRSSLGVEPIESARVRGRRLLRAPSPSTTPTTPQKALPQVVKQDTLTVPGALQVQVQCAGGLANSSGPVITLEVPNADQYRCLSPITELPTPVPTPVPSPLPTPCRYRPKPRTSSESNDNKDSEDTESEFSLSISVERSSSDSSGPDHRVFFTPTRNLHSLHHCSPHRSETLSPTGATLTPSSTMSSRTPSPDTSPTISPVSSPKIKVKPPPLTIPNANVLEFNPEKPSTSRDPACGEISLQVPVIKVDSVDDGTRWDSTPRTRSQSVDVGSILQAPLITISPAEEEHPSASTSSSQPPLIIPTLNVTLASPPALKKQYPPVPTISIEAPEPPKPPEVPIRRHAPVIREKTGSLELQPAPAITITNTLTDAESDTDSPTGTCRRGGPPSCYLSPFLGVDLRASESNLSSSGYSSAYSPGPSRCSSNNPLLPDEPMTPSVSSIPSRPMQIPGPPPAVTAPPRTKRRPLLKTPPTEVSPMPLPAPLVRTDSETTDDPAASSQPEADSALELDTNDECSDGVAHGVEASKLSGVDEAEAQRQRLLMSSSQSFPKESPRLTRSPPSIVVHASLQSESSLEDCLTDKPSRLSPVSSRSESPISDSRLSVARIYPAFFGVSGKPELPYTDSDGLYDCPSSEVLNSDCHASASPLKRLGRKRLKRTSGKGIKSFLGLGSVGSGEGCSGASAAPAQSEGAKSRLEPPHWERSPRRLSPKRRVRAQTSVDLLSSSNESITSQRYVFVVKSSQDLLKMTRQVTKTIFSKTLIAQ
nr:mucin-5AC-like [Penaeus vannamei]